MTASTTMYTSAYASSTGLTGYESFGLILLSLLVIGIGVYLIRLDSEWDIRQSMTRIMHSRSTRT